jgi:dTDP-4-amino-4,6-dideoxygalactose transaminase
VANRYTELLNGVVTTPVVPKGFYSSWAQYTIQLKDRETRDAMQTALKEAGIPSMVYYPKPMHKQEAFGISGDYQFDCSNTRELCDTVLSLPMHPYLREDEIDLVVKTIKENLSPL